MSLKYPVDVGEVYLSELYEFMRKIPQKDINMVATLYMTLRAKVYPIIPIKYNV